MKKTKKRNTLNFSYTQKTVPISLIDTTTDESSWDKKELKARATYFLLNGASEFSVNESENGRFKLLALERDFWAYKLTGVREVSVRVYSFNDKNAECFSLIERLKTERLGVMEEAYLMKRLIDEFSFTQDDIGALIGKSRPNIANTMRLLTLTPEVIGLIESGKLSAGHARTLVKVDKEKQYAFA